jgi:DNA-directed RNA polymerase I, II, and III subunit RPABC1
MEGLLLKIGQLNNSATASYNLVLERVLYTTIEMLKDRGYNVVNDCRTLGDITYKMQENEAILFGDHSQHGNVIVYFHNEERVGVKQLRQWNEKNPNSNIIIVSLEGPTAFTKKEADQHFKNCQFFLFQQLCVNITKHSLVPKHEKLTREEINKLNFKVSDLFPKLYTNDAISQYFNYKVGDLIRITRTIGYPEPIYYYRLVCSPPLF